MRDSLIAPMVAHSINNGVLIGMLWWILDEPEGPGYIAAGAGGQQITVLPKSRAVTVYLSDIRPNSEITAEDLKPLNKVFDAAFP